jgi:Flp pilus assembly protein TadB
MAPYSAIRASDADREHVAERLRKAAAEGRLLAEELEQRLAAALRARTYGELNPLVADLPGERKNARASSPVRAGLALATVLAAITLIALAVLVVTGVLAAWGLWALFAWWCFGGHCARRRRSLRPGRNWQVSRQADRRAWL